MSKQGYRSPRDLERMAAWGEKHAGHEVVQGRRTRKCMTCRNGYADVDDVAVERAAGGRSLLDGVRLSVAEREQVVQRCRKARVPLREIARRAGCHERTVLRIAARIGA